VIGDLLGIGETSQAIWSIAQWPILAFAAVSMVALLYYATPNVKQPKFRWMGMGAAVALLIIATASVGQAVYLRNFPNLDLTYGSVAGILIFLLWIWFANIALIFGAHINTEVERVRQLQVGIPAEEEVHLFPRDTRSTRRLDKRREKNVATARAIRKRAAALSDTEDHAN
jgi:membrane protein